MRALQFLTTTNRNYSCVIIGFIIVLATALWFSYSGSRYDGTVLDELVAMRTTEGADRESGEGVVVHAKITKGERSL